MVGTTVGLSVSNTVGLFAGTRTVPLMDANVFSARLTTSIPFEFGGGRHDLALHLGHGITAARHGLGNAHRSASKGYKLVLPFTGSAVALGRTG